MKFYTNQLPDLIVKIKNNHIKSLLLYGYNRGFISSVISQLVTKFNFLVIEISGKDLNSNNLNILGNSKNFFKQPELLKINYTGSGLSKDLKESLAEYDFANFLCFVCDESLPASGIRKFFEDANHLAIMPCYYEDENTVAKIAISFAKQHNKIIDSEALFYIKEKLNGDHQLIKNELEKLIFYTHDKSKISYQDALSSINSGLSGSGDEMCIYFSTEHAQLFLLEIEKLKGQNINEVLIIRALIRYYINLFIVCLKIENDVNIDLAIKSLSPPIFFKYVKDFRKVAQKITSGDALKIISLLQKAEIDFKTNPKTFDFFNNLYLSAYGAL